MSDTIDEAKLCRIAQAVGKHTARCAWCSAQREWWVDVDDVRRGPYSTELRASEAAGDYLERGAKVVRVRSTQKEAAT